MNKNILIVSSDYKLGPEFQKAELIILLWNIGSMHSTFTILKNLWGYNDEKEHIPIELLTKVLANPSGKLVVDWKT